MAREKKPVHKVQMTEGKRNIIQMLLQVYNIEFAQDSEGEQSFEVGSYQIWRLFLSGDSIKGKIDYLLRIGVFSQYAGKTILNNVYMDLRGKSRYSSEHGR